LASSPGTRAAKSSERWVAPGFRSDCDAFEPVDGLFFAAALNTGGSLTTIGSGKTAAIAGPAATEYKCLQRQ
jgi:hypothetical protein